MTFLRYNYKLSIIEDVYIFLKTMVFCNKGVVQADPPPPSYGQRPYFYLLFLDPSLNKLLSN